MYLTTFAFLNVWNMSFGMAVFVFDYFHRFQMKKNTKKREKKIENKN